MMNTRHSHPGLGRMIVLAVAVMSLAACGGGAVDSTPLPGATEPSAPDMAVVTETPKPEAASTGTVAPTGSVSTSGEAVSFENDVLPILNSRCLQCHGGDDNKGGLSLASYAALMAGSEDGPVVVPGDAENSRLTQVVVDGSMPKRGPDLFPEQIQILIDWVNAGAPDN